MKRAVFFFTALLAFSGIKAQTSLELNEKGYLEMPGLNVTVFADIYPESHQTGVTIIQHGQRVVANGEGQRESTLTQYVMGGGSTNFMFLVLAVDKYLNN